MTESGMVIYNMALQSYFLTQKWMQARQRLHQPVRIKQRGGVESR